MADPGTLSLGNSEGEMMMMTMTMMVVITLASMDDEQDTVATAPGGLAAKKAGRKVTCSSGAPLRRGPRRPEKHNMNIAINLGRILYGCVSRLV